MSSPPSPTPRPPDPPPLPAADEYADPGARAIDLSQRPVADSLREIMASSPRLPKQMPPPLPAAAPTFPNRHGTLALVGLIHLLMALVMASESVWHLVTGGWHGLSQDPPERARLLVDQPVFIVWALVLSIGCLLARRWARALTLGMFRQTLVWMALAAVAMGVNNAGDFRAELSPFDQRPAWEHLVLVGFVAAFAWFMVALLRDPQVRMTCENAQPKPDWTDRRAASELILFWGLVGWAASWAALATHHAWPCWGAWRTDDRLLVWGAAALAAALAAGLVAGGRATGAWFALLLAAAFGSSVILTALHEPVEEFTEVWGRLDLNLRGGLTYSIAETVAVAALAVAALRARRRRRSPALS